MGRREGGHGPGTGDRLGDSGDGGHTGALGGASGAQLVAQGPHGRRAGADPGDAGVDDGLGEGIVLGQEAVTGVNGVGAGGAGHGQDGLGIGVRGAFGQGVRLIGEFGSRTQDVLGGVREYGGASQIADRAYHAQGDLTAVGDEDAVECPTGHQCAPRVRRPPARIAGPTTWAGEDSS